MKEETQSKSTDAQKRAAKKYAQKVDHISLIAPKGTKQKIGDMGEKVSSYVNTLVEKDLKSRHKDVLKGVRKRIQKDLKSCNTVKEWHDAFSRLRKDFEDEVYGERDFEEYIAKVLGKEAVEKFAKNITVPPFDDDVLKHMSAMDDFFEERDNCEWLDADAVPENARNLIDAWNSPEFCAMEDYKYLSHLHASAVLRCEQMEAAITDLLGEEAFTRLVSQGSYKKDNLYYAAMASTKNKNKQSKFFIDWLAGRGIFAPDEESSNIEEDFTNEGWKSPSQPPESTMTVEMLLADGAVRIGLYIPEEEGHKEFWMSANRDYKRLVIGWQPLEFQKERDFNDFALEAYAKVLENMPDKNTIEGEPNWEDIVAGRIEERVVAIILAINGATHLPPKDETSKDMKETLEAARMIATVMAETGACRQGKIWRAVSERVSISNEPKARETAWTACQRAGIITNLIGGLVVLTPSGIVFSGKDAPVPSVLFVDGLDDEATANNQRQMEICENLFLASGIAEPMDSDILLAIGTSGMRFAELFSAGGREFMMTVTESQEKKAAANVYANLPCDLPLLMVVHGEKHKLERHEEHGKAIICVGYTELPKLLASNSNDFLQSLECSASS